MSKTLILDNGSFSIKAGFVTDEACKEFPNYVMKTKQSKMVYVSDLIDKTTDLSGLYFHSPFENGYIVNWDVQLSIWDRLYEDSALNCTPNDTNLVLTEPIFNPPSIKTNLYELIFEEYEFPSLISLSASEFVAKSNYLDLFQKERSVFPDSMIVVDIASIQNTFNRIDVGGLTLTNFLKHIVSYRSWDIRDDYYIANDIKEKCCFVSQNFNYDLKNFKDQSYNNKYHVNYVLPDFTSSKKGIIKISENSENLKDNEQILSVKNERITVPEILFYPSDIGINQGGIHEAVLESIESCPERIRGLLANNIVVIGGTSHLPGLKDRLEKELRKLFPESFDVGVFIAPRNFSWQAGKSVSLNLTQNTDQNNLTSFLSKSEYQEIGSSRTVEYFK
ncbi:hypothetical protein BB561_003673 [Smittium simulii]|uniref:Actin-like protein ARP6 n=1 Tax=Smittium simulii TaxID=133385 RepID=A0A2T9YK27_9FUNG|nr:hypothetical protein BB561_003673 [Smittium simulii]